MKSSIRNIIVLILSLSISSLASFSYAADDTSVKQGTKEKVQSVVKIKKNETEKKQSQTTETATNTETATGQNDILETPPTVEEWAKEIIVDEKDTELTTEEKEKVKQELNEYIINSYKAQGNKIMRDLDTKLQKAIPDADEREEAYRKILTSLKLREQRIENMKAGETKKLILREFLNHMIASIEKKIENIEK